MRRNFGLDIYRSIAILMVLACHSLLFFFVAWFNAVPLAYVLGLGVEIFFALSGFLIGGILIRDVVEQERPVSAPRKLFSFYIRRWLRTLPLYYLMVVVSLYYTQWPHVSLSLAQTDKLTLLTNLFFLQNFQASWLSFQPVTWSLSIEEWFYLLIPLGMLAISFARQRRMRARLILFYGLTVILAVLAYRTADFLLTHTTWDYGTRQQIFMHMDALMFGVLAAWLQHYHATVYARLARSRVFGALALVVVAFFAYRYVFAPILHNTIDSSLMAHTLSLSIMGVGFAALVMVFQAQFADISRFPGWVIRLFEHISTRSYAYYLIHWPIFVLMLRVLVAGSLTQNIAVDVIALTLTFLIAAAAHLLIERPFMRLRDRVNLIPRVRPAPAAPAPAAPAPAAPTLDIALTHAEAQEAESLPVTQYLPRISR